MEAQSSARWPSTCPASRAQQPSMPELASAAACVSLERRALGRSACPRRLPVIQIPSGQHAHGASRLGAHLRLAPAASPAPQRGQLKGLHGLPTDEARLHGQTFAWPNVCMVKRTRATPARSCASACGCGPMAGRWCLGPRIPQGTIPQGRVPARGPHVPLTQGRACNVLPRTARGYTGTSPCPPRPACPAPPPPLPRAQPHPPGTLPRIPAHRSLPVIQGFGWQQNLPRHPHSHAASYEAYASLAPRLPRSAQLRGLPTGAAHPAAHAPTARDLYLRFRIWAHGPAWGEWNKRKRSTGCMVKRLHGHTASWSNGGSWCRLSRPGPYRMPPRNHRQTEARPRRPPPPLPHLSLPPPPLSLSPAHLSDPFVLPMPCRPTRPGVIVRVAYLVEPASAEPIAAWRFNAQARTAPRGAAW
jgi:hypothetical protein